MAFEHDDVSDGCTTVKANKKWRSIND
jgi:hypothetical protein